MIKLKPHNKKAVDQIIDLYKSGHRSVLYTSGVGTGKSYVFMGIVDKFLKKSDQILYIIPKKIIQKNLEEYADFKKIPNEVVFKCFKQFEDVKKGRELIRSAKMIVIDEAHHLWAEQSGKNLCRCMDEYKKEYPDKIFLGLTATPKREACINGHTINVETDELFDATVNGISNFEAIEQGLMPKFNYRLLVPDENPKDIEMMSDRNVKVKVDCLDCKQTLIDIINTYKRDKWILYFSDTKTLNYHKKFIEEVFKGYEIFVLYSSLGNLDEVIEGLKKQEKAVVLSVDMLLEGVHLPNITGIVMFRNISSLVVFQQILGRVCSIGNKVEPVIVDGSDNGPRMLDKLNSMIYGYDGEGKIVHFHEAKKKQILTLGIGSHKKWNNIEDFLMSQAGIIGDKYKKISDVKTAANKYNSFSSIASIYPNLDEWKGDSTSYEILKGCAKTWHVSELMLSEYLTQI